MSERNDADVLIVGAGPVGTTLAIDLAQRGVSVTLAEMRADEKLCHFILLTIVRKRG
jgi:2-polyprenyl-6-methoxyphenol hydroxylase-like FAD-dependent oxidoreductase